VTVQSERQNARRFVVTRAEEVKDGERVIVDIGGRSIGIFNVGGRYYAMLNRCPHQGGPLCFGDLLNLVESSSPGEYRFDQETRVVSCPWHGWEFDLETGQSYFDPVRTRVRSYRVDVANGAEVNSDGDISTALFSVGQRPGPYRAETFPVSVDGDYLVVTIGEALERPT
jgi:nitrite reductase/ring-hydroxylating ferredoxin subunit